MGVLSGECKNCTAIDIKEQKKRSKFRKSNLKIETTNKKPKWNNKKSVHGSFSEQPIQEILKVNEERKMESDQEVTEALRNLQTTKYTKYKYTL